MECAVCFCRCEKTLGVVCSRGHFLCRVCLEGYVRSEAAPDKLSALVSNGGKLKCPCFSSDGRRCSCPGFSPASLAFHLPEPVFEMWEAAKDRATEKRVSEQVREGHNAELRRLEELAAANQRGNPAGTLEDRIGMKREHVIEKLLTLRCPNPACEVAFLDFEGCLALKCSACGTGFCAFCLANCGRDAHSHVAVCPEAQGTKTRGYYATFQQFEKVQQRRRMRLVAEYLDKIEDDNDRTQLLESVAKELKDLNISPNKLKKRGAALRKGPATPKRNLYPRAANGLAAMIGFPHPLEAFLPDHNYGGMADNLQDIYKRDAHRERGLLQRPRVAQYHAAAAAQHTDIDGRWKRLRPLGDPDAAIRAAEERDLELAIQASLQERQQKSANSSGASSATGMGGGLKHCSAQGNLPAPKASEIIDLCNYPKPSYPAEQKPAPSNQIHGLQDGFSDEVIIVDLIDASPPKKQNYVGKPTTGQLPGGSAVIVIDD